jgi:hypothetical protein
MQRSFLERYPDYRLLGRKEFILRPEADLSEFPFRNHFIR